jgi:predicted ATPase
MITKLFIRNFRAIEDYSLDLAKITVLTGANNAGKSSVIYALLALKNVATNPNQGLDSFLTLPFLNLGGFSQTVFGKDEDLNIGLGIEVSKDDIVSKYSMSLGKKTSEIDIDVSKPFKVPMKLDVTFPYPANLTTGYELKTDLGTAKISWNGISSTISFQPNESVSEEEKIVQLRALSESLTLPTESLRGLDFVPLGRGFVSPIYSAVPMQPQLVKDTELATLLATNRDLEGKVALYLEKVVDRVFSVRPTIGTANFNLQSRDRLTGFICDLVNEGFGTNQLVTILTKALRKEMTTICIEEAEIHLHPGLMDKLVEVLIEIVNEEGKTFIISTHSEHIVLSLLNRVARKILQPNDLALYYFTKARKRVQIEKQKINEKGQVSGGLQGFYETELKEINGFFQSPEIQ